VCLNRNPFSKAVGHPFVFLDRKGFIAAERLAARTFGVVVAWL
jgi:hypothetical protein